MSNLINLAKLIDDLKQFKGDIFTADGREITLTTEHAKYNITVHAPSAVCSKGYMGCIATNRLPWQGETHKRGRDLMDGMYGEDTWYKIIKDIQSYEKTFQ